MKKIIVKQMDFKFNELGTCEHNELRRDISCYRDEKLAEIVKANLDKLVVVAEIGRRLVENGKELESAYRLTNTVEFSWYENLNIGVTEFAVKGCRSTSIGDVVEMDGINYMVNGCGFLELGAA